jgi:5,10-methylene-tetrahydrofolate dehydrogenase/methenyl tetrahydrofolate cyclohydrolase
LNIDADVHAILVQLPLPEHLSPHHVTEAVTVTKDVDGFHSTNQGSN